MTQTKQILKAVAQNEHYYDKKLWVAGKNIFARTVLLIKLVASGSMNPEINKSGHYESSFPQNYSLTVIYGWKAKSHEQYLAP